MRPSVRLLFGNTLTVQAAVIRFFKPKLIQLPSERDEPLSPTSAAARRALSATRNAHSTAKFDLALARASVAVDALIYLLMIASTGGLMFAVVTACGALGMGERAVEAAQRAFKSALTRPAKRVGGGGGGGPNGAAANGVEGGGAGFTGLYERTDKINYEFGGYDLAFASFELRSPAQ